MSDLTRRQPGGEFNPLAQLPPGWAEPVGLFFAVYSDILRGTVGLAARLRLWEAEEGLTLDDAKLVMRRVMRPDKAATIQHVGQLMAALAEGVATVVRDRRAAARSAEQRRQFAAEEARFGGPGLPALPVGGDDHAV